MSRGRSAHRIIDIPREAEVLLFQGRTTGELRRRHPVSEPTSWRNAPKPRLSFRRANAAACCQVPAVAVARSEMTIVRRCKPGAEIIGRRRRGISGRGDFSDPLP